MINEVIKHLKITTQPQSIEEIMIGIRGKEYQYDNKLAKSVNQIIDKLEKEGYLLSKKREERIVNGLPYIPGGMTYYLNYDGNNIRYSYTLNKYVVFFKEPKNLLSPVIGFLCGAVIGPMITKILTHFHVIK